MPPRVPPWKRFVDELRAAGRESRYADQLNARLDVWQAQADLEREIAQEMASALGRTEEKLVVALLELEVLDQRLAGARAGERAGLVEAFNAKRADAAEALRHLVIHREAVGFRRHEMVYKLYPIPPRRRAE